MTETLKHFLVLESHPDDAFIIRRAFRAIPHCSCFVCRNGSEAKSYLQGTGMYSDRGTFPLPVAIISESRLGLDPVDGFFEWLCEKPDFQFPIILFASATSEVDPESLRRLRVSKVLTKPIDLTAWRNDLAALAEEFI